MFSRSLAAAVVQRTCISCGVVFRRSAFPFERRLPRARALPRGRSAPSLLPLGAQTTRRNQSIAPPLHGPATHYHALAGRQCYPAWLAVPAKVLLPCRQCKRRFAPCQSVSILLTGMSARTQSPLKLMPPPAARSKGSGGWPRLDSLRTSRVARPFWVFVERCDSFR